MSLRALNATVVRVLGEWATPPTTRDQGALWRVIEDGRGYPVLQTRILTRDRWVDANPRNEAEAVWDGLCRALAASKARTDAKPRVRDTRKTKASQTDVREGQVVEDVDGAEWRVKEVRTQGPVPVILGHQVGGNQKGGGSVILTEPLRDYILGHDDWRAGLGLPISPRVATNIRKRLGVSMVGLVAAKWERATALGGTRAEIAERAGVSSFQAATWRAEERRRAKPVPRSKDADAAILAAKDDDALRLLEAAWETSLDALKTRRGQLRRAAGQSVPGAKPRPRPLFAEDGPRHATAFGETRTVRQWAKDPRCAVGYTTVLKRLSDGWEPERAISTPATPRGERNLKPFGRIREEPPSTSQKT